MVSTFIQILTSTENGSFVPVNPSYPEIIDLTERKYVKQNKKLHNKDGLIAYVAVKGANAVDLLTDLGYTAADREELSTIISSELIEAMTQAQTPAPAAPTTDAAYAAPAPQVPQVPSAPEPSAALAVPAVPTATDATQTVPAAPTLGGVVLAQATTPVAAAAETAPAVQQELNVGEAASAAVSTIDFDVDFEAPASKPTSKTIDYDGLVKAKLAHPDTKPSLHIAGKKSKDISVPVRKQAEYYEQHNGITFRVRTVGDSDPKGAGVRIFALTVAEAPERRKFGGAK